MAITDRQYDFTMHCPVFFGLGTAGRIAEKVAKFGVKNVFLISDAGNVAVGHPARIAGLLRDAGFTVTEYYDVQPDPNDAKGDEVGQLAKDAGAELVIGIGGGSSIDTAKMVGVALANPGPISQHFVSPTGLPPSLLTAPPIAPVIALPTTAGSGSEMSGVAVVSNAKDDVKDSILAHMALAIVDPELTATAPPHITGYAGLDAMAHAVEAYTTANPDPFSDLLALEAIRLITKYLRRAYVDGNDMEARSYLSLASNFAGTAFTNCGLHYGHTFAHEVGVVFHLPHGMAASYVIPSMIKFIAKHVPERGQNLAAAFGVPTPEEAVQTVLDLMHSVEVKRFSELGITVEQVQAVAQDAIDHNTFFPNTVARLSVEDFKEVIAGIIEDYEL